MSPRNWAWESFGVFSSSRDNFYTPGRWVGGGWRGPGIGRPVLALSLNLDNHSKWLNSRQFMRYAVNCQLSSFGEKLPLDSKIIWKFYKDHWTTVHAKKLQTNPARKGTGFVLTSKGWILPQGVKIALTRWKYPWTRSNEGIFQKHNINPLSIITGNTQFLLHWRFVRFYFTSNIINWNMMKV